MTASRALVAACCVATLLPAATAEAQEIRGRVVDSDNGAPVGLAGVFLLDTERELVRGAASDSAGSYTIEAPEPGEYVVFVQRLGYFENETPLLAVGSEGPYTLDIEMRPEPFRLDPLDVVVRNEELERFLTLDLGVNPNGIFGYRAIQGARLHEARMKARDNTDLLRWLYIPVSHGIEVCVNTVGRTLPERGHWGTSDSRPARQQLGARGCGTLKVDGYRVPNEHIESIDFDEIAVVVTLPGEVRLYTRQFEWTMRPGRFR